MSATEKLELVDFSILFDCEVEEFSPAVLQQIAAGDFRYEWLEGEKLQAALGPICARIVEQLPRPDTMQQQNWDAFWGDALTRLREAKPDDDLVDVLSPRYLVRPLAPIRLKGAFAAPAGPLFERDFARVLRAYLFDKLVAWARPGADVLNVMELGCGTGHNLLAFARQNLGCRLIGADWTSSSNQIISELGWRAALEISSLTFDMLCPPNYRPRRPLAVFTWGALEQVGKRWGPVLRYLVRARPAVCLHVEPLEELYDQNDFHDQLALAYHRKRGYLSGFLPALERVAQDGEIEILEQRRVHFGPLHHDGYSWVAWKPN